MKKELTVPDTEQTKRLKKFAISGVYSNGGEILKLLHTKSMHSLVVKIKKGEVEASELVFDKDTITLEERFLENVDRYITYVRNHYYFDTVEQYLALEESLSTKYAEILLHKDNVHSSENQYEKIKKYSAGYIRMFISNFYNNIKLFSEEYEDNFYTKKLYEDLFEYDFDDDKDIFEISFV